MDSQSESVKKDQPEEPVDVLSCLVAIAKSLREIVFMMREGKATIGRKG